MKVILSIIAGVAVLAAVVYIGVFGGGVPQLRLVKLEPPEGFVATDYQELQKLSDADGFTVLNLAEYGTYFENYYLPDQQVVYFSLFGNDDNSIHLFLDRNGSVIGTIDAPRRPFPMGNHFIAFDGYYEITPNGVSAMKPYEVVEGLVSQDQLAQLHGESTLFWRFSDRDVRPDRPEYSSKLITHAMLHNGIWKKVVSEFDGYLAHKSLPFTSLDAQYRHAPDARPVDLKTFNGGKYMLRRPHFDRQEYFAHKAAAWGSTTGVGRPEHYRGTGYYTVTAGEHALRFAIENDASDGYINLVAEGYEGLDLIVLEYRARGNEQIGFVVSVAEP